jgi:hypothetical protein
MRIAVAVRVDGFWSCNAISLASCIVIAQKLGRFYKYRENKNVKSARTGEKLSPHRPFPRKWHSCMGAIKAYGLIIAGDNNVFFGHIFNYPRGDGGGGNQFLMHACDGASKTEL